MRAEKNNLWKDLSLSRKIMGNTWLPMVAFCFFYSLVEMGKTLVIPVYFGVLFERFEGSLNEGLQFHAVVFLVSILIYFLDFACSVAIDPYVEKNMNLSRLMVLRRYHKESWHVLGKKYTQEEQVNRLHYGVMGAVYLWSSLIFIVQKVVIILAVFAVLIGNKKSFLLLLFFFILSNLIFLLAYDKLCEKKNLIMQEKNSRMEGAAYKVVMQVEDVVLGKMDSLMWMNFESIRKERWRAKLKKDMQDIVLEEIQFVMNHMWRIAMFDEISRWEGKNTFLRGNVTLDIPGMNALIDMEITAMNEMMEPMKRIKLFSSMLLRLNEFLPYLKENIGISDESSAEKEFLAEEDEILRIENASFEAEEQIILNNISFSLKKGEMVALIGENGCGKTTLLRCICGLYNPSSGRILKKYGGKWIDKNEQNIFAYAPVDNQLYQETTRFNVDTGTMGKHGGNDELYKMFGMEEKKEIQIESLSQGQQQRVNIMRAIVKDAEIIILDEPFANLDYSIISQIVNYIRTQKKTVICTLHDRELLQYFDRILRIENGTASEITL